LIPALVAVIVTDPTDTPVTTPVPDTVATAAELDLHSTAFVRLLPLASRGDAESVVVAPTSTDAVPGVTTTDATAGGPSLLEEHPRATTIAKLTQALRLILHAPCLVKS
jgi:hypothetical protein